MKKLIIGFSLIVMLMSCDREAEVRVSNSVSNVEIESIAWNGEYVSGNLLPGMTSSFRLITDTRDQWPKAGPVTFTMTANGQSVYLQTTKTYTLDEGDQLTITIDENTPVINPR